MAVSTLMSIGTRAMFANMAALTTTGHNISNANVAGYSRQTVSFETSQGQFGGAGYFGRGVEVQGVERAHDAFLTREAQLTASLASMDQTRVTQLEQLQKLFANGEGGIGYSAGQIFNAMVDVATNPQDLSARQVVLSNAQTFAAQLNTAATQIDALQGGVVGDLKVSVATVNDLARQVAALNAKIAATRGTGASPNDMLDQRDQLIAEIGQHLQVNTISAEDGSLNLFAGGGQVLVLGANATQLGVMADPYDQSLGRISVIEGNGAEHLLDASSITGGKIAGLLRFQDDDLVAARNQLGVLASAVAGAVNERQSLGLDLGTPADWGDAMFDTGTPRVLNAATNARDGAGNFASNPTLAITDASQLKASDYELRADPAGNPGVYQLTRKSDGAVFSVADGDTVDGFRIDLGTPAPGASDRFLLQPVGRAAYEIRRTLADPAGIAAASPVVGTKAAANTGTGAISALAVVDKTIDPALTASVRFTSTTGDYDWELRDAGNNVVGSGSATWSAGTPIALNGVELSLTGKPNVGDSFSVAPTTFAGSNNGNAMAFVDLRNQAIADGMTVTDHYATTLANIGVRVQGAQAAADTSGAVAAAAKEALTSETGVNLDEEAARLLQFQQCYQAAAKILQVAQSVFDTLLDMTNG